MTTTIEPTTKPRGLAACSPEKRREIARKGGKAVQVRGTAHKWTPDEASEAGRKARANDEERAKKSEVR